MDATVQLSIIEKLRGMFAENRSYLICAHTPAVYSGDSLNAISGSATASQLAFESSWTRSVNFVPAPSALLPNEARYLWDVLSELKLTEVVLAEGSGDPASKEQVKAAEVLLYEDPKAEIRRFSEAFKAYLELQDLHLEAIQIYRQREGEVGEGDAAAETFWEQTAEPAYRGKIESAMFRWQTEGRKAEIEAARQVLARAAEAHPEAQWTRWMSQFVADIDAASDLNLLQFVPTSFSPSNIAEEQDWAVAEIDSRQYEQLVAGAPAELKQRLYSADPGFSRLRFEFARLSVERAWFPRATFDARFWKFPDDTAPFSDGGDPPSGRLPGYVTAAILVRNVVVTKPSPPPPPPPPLGGRFIRLREVLGAIRPRMLAARAAPAEAPPVRSHVALRPLEMMRVQPAVTAEPEALKAALAERRAMPTTIARDISAVSALRLHDQQIQQLMKQAITPASIAAAGPTVDEHQVAATDVCALVYLWKGFGPSPNPDPVLFA